MRFQTGSGSIALNCHPATPSRAIHTIEVSVSATDAGGIALAFSLNGELCAALVPEPAGTARRGTELWRHTCCEVFAMAGDGPGYREYNFSPSGEWAVYAFRGYRDGDALDVEFDPLIAVERDQTRLELDAEIGPALLPAGECLRLGLSAVVEDADGALSYWSLRHPPGRPDFHHRDAFAMQLALSRIYDPNLTSPGVRP
jgi:hypothetical protein